MRDRDRPSLVAAEVLYHQVDTVSYLDTGPLCSVADEKVSRDGFGIGKVNRTDGLADNIADEFGM